jgi:hypothetical protein
MLFSSSLGYYFDGICGAGFGANATGNALKRVVCTLHGTHGIGGAYCHTHQAADAERFVQHHNALGVNG